MSVDELYSVFEKSCPLGLKEYVFYFGDCTLIYDKKDWRFCKMEGKRNELVFLGLGEMSFPIKYPLKLNNGKILEEIINK